MSYSKKYGKGWFNESYRHSLARQGIRTKKSFDSGKKFAEKQFIYGKKGNIIGAYVELLGPHGPGIDFNKKKKTNYSIKITNGPKLKGDIMIDLNTIKKRHPQEFKIISNESYNKLRKTGVKLRPNEDTDGDGLINIKDARPLNKKDFRDNTILQKISDWVNNN